ncbi:MAG TPA: DUF2993 domain-containing protein [Pseudonocardia sp.]|jgi:hypothetical protein|nr:DUF2993 domain-containing protein [Pseudonocardia sp.]
MKRGARVVVVLLVLAGLLVVGDFAAAAVAESAVSRQLRDQLGLRTDPDVRINGFPFTTQALAGEYGSVDVAADGVAVGELRDLEVSAQLRDVRAPLSALLGSGPRTLVVGEAEGTVRVSADGVERLVGGVRRLRIDTLDAAALQVAVDNGGDPGLAGLDPDRAAHFVGLTSVLGQDVEFFVIAVLDLVDGQILVEPRDVVLGAAAFAVPDVLSDQLEERFTVRIDPGVLPLEVTPTQVRARDGHLEISGRTEGLVLGGSAP